MKTFANVRPLQRFAVWVAYAATAFVGLKYGYGFGKQISGTLLGVVLAINSVVFGTIVVSMLADRVFGPKAADPKEP